MELQTRTSLNTCSWYLNNVMIYIITFIFPFKIELRHKSKTRKATYLFVNFLRNEISGTAAKFYIKKSPTHWTASGTMLTITHKTKSPYKISKCFLYFLLNLMVFIKCIIMAGKHGLLYKIKGNIIIMTWSNNYTINQDKMISDQLIQTQWAFKVDIKCSPFLRHSVNRV